jgi:hypothetical protein
MNPIEVNLLNYKFLFRPLTWREEFSMKFEPNKDRLRTILSHALTEVSGLTVKSVAEAQRILEAVPATVVYRVFVIYKSSLPQSKIFTTMGLYRAPEPNRMAKKFEEAATEEEERAEKFSHEMEQKFGRQELAEQREMELLMLKNSKARGVTRATPDESDAPPKPQPRQDDKKGLGTRPPNKLTPGNVTSAPSTVNIGSTRKENVE